MMVCAEQQRPREECYIQGNLGRGTNVCGGALSSVGSRRRQGTMVAGSHTDRHRSKCELHVIGEGDGNGTSYSEEAESD